MNTQETIKKLAEIEAAHVAGLADQQLERAIKDGDDMPAVKVVINMVIGKSGDIITYEAESKAVRNITVKTKKIIGEVNPNQPELF